MEIIGQPEKYTDILKRIFYVTLATVFSCTLVIATASARVGRLLDSVGINSELGPIKPLKLLYVVLPFGIAFIARIVKLHDRISDVLRLRHHIDTRRILAPLAEGVGIALDENRRQLLSKRRRDLMYSVFYPYVGLPDAKIDPQLVRTALDSLGWLWAFVEATLFVAVTAVLLFFLGARVLGVYWAVLTVLGLGGATWLWLSSKGHTKAEVKAILNDPHYREEVRRQFAAILETGNVAPSPTVVTPKELTETVSSYDLFISHASEDKETVARPLYEALTAEGITVWFDEATLQLGDSLGQKIDQGLATCRFGVVVLSPSFFAKEWPRRELDGLVARETASGDKAILPIWHQINAATLSRYSPTLAGKVAATSSQGIPSIVKQIRAVLRK